MKGLGVRSPCVSVQPLYSMRAPGWKCYSRPRRTGTPTCCCGSDSGSAAWPAAWRSCSGVSEGRREGVAPGRGLGSGCGAHGRRDVGGCGVMLGSLCRGSLCSPPLQL